MKFSKNIVRCSAMPNKSKLRAGLIALALVAAHHLVTRAEEPSAHRLHLPDAEIAAAYEKAAVQNVLAAVNPKVFPGYWSVCANGIGRGYGNTFPALDGH